MSQRQSSSFIINITLKGAHEIRDFIIIVYDYVMYFDPGKTVYIDEWKE